MSFVCFMFIYVSLMGMEELSFDLLERNSASYDGREVTMRGFLYQLQDGQWVLAQQPNLRTCCVQKNSYVLLNGNGLLKVTDTAVSIEGIFRTEGQHRIDVAGVVSKNSSIWIIIAAIIAGVIGIIIYVRSR
jgi:hypothetical protein